MSEPQRQPTHLQRVPPNDPRLEAHLLGAAILTGEAAAVVAATSDDAWYTPRHQLVAAAITELHNQHSPCDAGTVGAHLRQLGHLDTIGGYQALIQLADDTPATRSASHWADRLERMAGERRLLHAAHEIVEAVYRQIPTAGLVADMHRAAANLDLVGESSWEPVNLAAVLAGEGPDTVPTVLARDDGVRLIYPGKVHAVNAEPESGKSWLCCYAAAQEIATGSHVVYIDFEADAGDLTNRLLLLGVSPADLLERFHYVRPQEATTPAATGRLLALCGVHHPTLVIIDGVTEVMANAGWSINDNDDIARFYATLPRPLAAAGPAVILVDHVVKDKESQGRWGIGAQHKLAGIDGAVYKLEAVTPFARGKPGSSRLIVSKDRHGQVRAHATAGTHQIAATVRFDATEDGGMTIIVQAPGRNQAESFLPTHFMDRISAAIEMAADQTMSKRAVRNAVSGKNDYKDLALAELVARGYLRPTGAGYRHIRRYHEPGAESPTDSDGSDMESVDDPEF